MTAASLTTRILFFFLICGCLHLKPCGAAEWPGRRLPTLIERWQAELIVFVDVVEAERKNAGQVSRLKIISIIKSDDRKVPVEIGVFIRLGTHWPYKFTEKHKAIAFLKFDKKRNLYVDYNGCDGGLDVDQATGQFYVRQFAKLPDILKVKGPRELLDLKLAWNVEFALRPKTRYQAAHGLEVLWDKAKKAKLLTTDESNSAADLLTASQKNKICQTFAKQVPNSNSYHLIRLLQRHPSPEIDSYLLESLRLSLKTEEAVPLDFLTISELAPNMLPQRVGFKLSETLKSEFGEYRERQSDYMYNISIGEEYTETERLNARTSLIKDWRRLTTKFLAIPELQKVQKY